MKKNRINLQCPKCQMLTKFLFQASHNDRFACKVKNFKTYFTSGYSKATFTLRQAGGIKRFTSRRNIRSNMTLCVRSISNGRCLAVKKIVFFTILFINLNFLLSKLLSVLPLWRVQLDEEKRFWGVLKSSCRKRLFYCMVLNQTFKEFDSIEDYKTVKNLKKWKTNKL